MIRELANYPCDGNSANLQKTADINRHSRERSQRKAADCGLATGTWGSKAGEPPPPSHFPNFAWCEKRPQTPAYDLFGLGCLAMAK
jgi:hypothetical protein